MRAALASVSDTVGVVRSALQTEAPWSVGVARRGRSRDTICKWPVSRWIGRGGRGGGADRTARTRDAPHVVVHPSPPFRHSSEGIQRPRHTMSGCHDGTYLFRPSPLTSSPRSSRAPWRRQWQQPRRATSRGRILARARCQAACDGSVVVPAANLAGSSASGASAQQLPSRDDTVQSSSRLQQPPALRLPRIGTPHTPALAALHPCHVQPNNQKTHDCKGLPW
eukprot:258345-Chlamydomonas_euryale.AAC.3